MTWISKWARRPSVVTIGCPLADMREEILVRLNADLLLRSIHNDPQFQVMLSKRRSPTQAVAGTIPGKDQSCMWMIVRSEPRDRSAGPSRVASFWKPIVEILREQPDLDAYQFDQERSGKVLHSAMQESKGR